MDLFVVALQHGLGSFVMMVRRVVSFENQQGVKYISDMEFYFFNLKFALVVLKPEPD